MDFIENPPLIYRIAPNSNKYNKGNAYEIQI